MNINVHIAKLVLDGIDIQPHHEISLKRAVEAEIKQKLMGSGFDSTALSRGDHRTLTGATISIDAAHDGAVTGKKIGEAVYRGISQ